MASPLQWPPPRRANWAELTFFPTPDSKKHKVARASQVAPGSVAATEGTRVVVGAVDGQQATEVPLVEGAAIAQTVAPQPLTMDSVPPPPGAPTGGLLIDA